MGNTVLVTFREMRFLFVACLAVTVSAAPQANFGKKIEVNERLGLLANDLGLDPTAETSQSAALTAETSAGASGQLPSGPVFSSTRTMTSSAPALSYQMPPPTTIMWPLGRLSLLPINSRVWSRLTCLKSE